jgi:hypothetical protein
MPEQRKFVMRPLTWVFLAIAVVCVVAAVVYFTKSAEHLPSFFPGHQAGLTKTHTKHGIAMLVVAVFALIGAWFTSAPRPDSADSTGQDTGSTAAKPSGGGE